MCRTVVLLLPSRPRSSRLRPLSWQPCPWLSSPWRQPWRWPSVRVDLWALRRQRTWSLEVLAGTVEPRLVAPLLLHRWHAARTQLASARRGRACGAMLSRSSCTTRCSQPAWRAPARHSNQSAGSSSWARTAIIASTAQHSTVVMFKENKTHSACTHNRELVPDGVQPILGLWPRDGHRGVGLQRSHCPRSALLLRRSQDLVRLGCDMTCTLETPHSVSHVLPATRIDDAGYHHGSIDRIDGVHVALCTPHLVVRAGHCLRGEALRALFSSVVTGLPIHTTAWGELEQRSRGTQRARSINGAPLACVSAPRKATCLSPSKNCS